MKFYCLYYDYYYYYYYYYYSITHPQNPTKLNTRGTSRLFVLLH